VLIGWFYIGYNVYFNRSCVDWLVLYRLQRLLQEIMGEKDNKTLVFVETKRKADELTRMMKRDG